MRWQTLFIEALADDLAKNADNPAVRDSGEITAGVARVINRVNIRLKAEQGLAIDLAKIPRFEPIPDPKDSE